METVEVVRTLLDAGADPNSEDSLGALALHHAAFGGSLVVAELLLKQQAKVDAQDSTGMTALAWACSRGREDFAQFLMNIGHADTTIIDQWLETTLHHAMFGGSSRIVRRLLDEDAIDIFAVNFFGRSALDLAVETCSLNITQMLLDKGAAAQGSLDRCWTPLHQASSRGFPQQYALMESLIDAGFDVNARDSKQRTPLHHVQWLFGGPDMEHAVALLLDNGADMEARDQYNQTPLLTQCDLKDKNESVICALLNRGANPNATDIRGMTPLHTVVFGDYPTLLNLLLAHGALPSVNNLNGLSPLHYAADYQSPSVDALLGHCIDVDLKSKDGKTALTFACLREDPGIVKILLEKGANALDADNEGQTPLHAACLAFNEDLALHLLESRSVNAVDVFWDDMTPLMLAAMGGKLRILEAILARDDANANQVNQEQDTALSIAALYGQDEIVRRLLKVETIDATHQNDTGMTALHMACCTEQLETIRTLLDLLPVLTNGQTTLGFTALNSSCDEGQEDVAALLLSTEDINVNLGAFEGKISPLEFAAGRGHHSIVKMLLSHDNIDVLALDWSGNNILFRSCEQGWVDVCEELWERSGVQDLAIRPVGKLCETPLHLAAEAGLIGIVRRLLRYNEVDIDALDSRDATPLWYAAANGHVECICVLLGQGAQASLLDIGGCTPLALAADLGCTTTIKLLLKQGVRADIDFALERALMRRRFAAADVLRKAGAVEVNDFLGLQRLFDPDYSIDLAIGPGSLQAHLEKEIYCYWL